MEVHEDGYKDLMEEGGTYSYIYIYEGSRKNIIQVFEYIMM